MNIERHPDLRLKPLDKTVRQDPNDPLPDAESSFVWLINANKGSGKSTALINYLTNKNFYYKAFDRVYLAVATVHSDSKWKKNIKLSKLEGLMAPEWDEKQLAEWMEDTRDEVESAKAEKENPPLTCVVIDDYASHLKFSRTLMNWILNSRHLKTSFFIATQKYALLPPYLRENADALQLYEPTSNREKEFILDDVLHPLMNKQRAEEITDMVWAKPRDFLFVNSRLPRNRRLHHNFDTIILQ
jgi:hypothetical protein